MDNQILGLHHITAIATDAQINYDFYTHILGQRLVKRTVNFDDPKTYHFYFGDEVGSPGSILTFFPWEGMSRGKTGNGMATEIGYAVNKQSKDFWLGRLNKFNIENMGFVEEFGNDVLKFEDPDGLKFSLVFTDQLMESTTWSTPEINPEMATRGFHHVVLSLKSINATASVLTGLLGYTLQAEHGQTSRFVNENASSSFIDLHEAPQGAYGQVAGGNIHHIAFQVRDESILMAYREKIARQGLNITEKIDRDYFYSVYFREPGGVLFELATRNPGFSHDEPLSELGINLKLPRQYESMRAKITAQLPALKL